MARRDTTRTPMDPRGVATNLATPAAYPNDDVRHTALRRCLRLMKLLHNARTWAGLQFYADRLETDTRTIRRYLIALEAEGYAVPQKPWGEREHLLEDYRDDL